MNDLCPLCDYPAVMRCACKLRDSACADGHSWHYCPVHQNRVLGSAAHECPDDCSCHLPYNPAPGQEAARMDEGGPP